MPTLQRIGCWHYTAHLEQVPLQCKMLLVLVCAHELLQILLDILKDLHSELCLMQDHSIPRFVV